MITPLYEFTTSYLTLLGLVGEGEEGDFEQALADLKDDFNTKAVNVAKMIRSIQASAKAYQEEAQRMTALYQSRINAVGRLTTYLHGEMTRAGINKVEGDVISLTMQNNPPSIEIPDEDAIEAHWKRAVLTLSLTEVPEEWIGHEGLRVSVDRRGILDWVKEGNEPPPGAMVTRGKHIRFR